jgi:hypothetical protein
LCDETAARCLQIPTLKIPNIPDEEAARIGAARIHELALVVAALYPSQTTLRRQYEWAATGILDRYQISYEHYTIFIRVYFEVTRDVLSADIHPSLERLETFMQQVLSDVFLGPADS